MRTQHKLQRVCQFYTLHSHTARTVKLVRKDFRDNVISWLHDKYDIIPRTDNISKNIPKLRITSTFRTTDMVTTVQKKKEIAKNEEQILQTAVEFKA